MDSSQLKKFGNKAGERLPDSIINPSSRFKDKDDKKKKKQGGNYRSKGKGKAGKK